jgi:hypothetical protein
MLMHQRLLSAQRRLEKTGDTIDQVAQAVGLQTAATLRQYFSSVLGTTPSAYRRRLGMKRRTHGSCSLGMSANRTGVGQKRLVGSDVPVPPRRDSKKWHLCTARRRYPTNLIEKGPKPLISGRPVVGHSKAIRVSACVGQPRMSHKFAARSWKRSLLHASEKLPEWAYQS